MLSSEKSKIDWCTILMNTVLQSRFNEWNQFPHCLSSTTPTTCVNATWWRGGGYIEFILFLLFLYYSFHILRVIFRFFYVLFFLLYFLNFHFHCISLQSIDQFKSQVHLFSFSPNPAVNNKMKATFLLFKMSLQFILLKIENSWTSLNNYDDRI